MEVLRGILAIIITLTTIGIAVAIHEFGHFIAARIAKIKVKEFAIGFGPKIFSVKSKKTDFKFSLRWIFLGGYVMVDSYQLRRLNYKEHLEEKKHEELLRYGITDKKQIKIEIKKELKEADNYDNEFYYKIEPVGKEKLLEDANIWSQIIFFLLGITFNLLLALAFLPLLIFLLNKSGTSNNIPINAESFAHFLRNSFIGFFDMFKVLINPTWKIQGQSIVVVIVEQGKGQVTDFATLFVNGLIAINISLFMLNILPIPPLDGWRFVSTLYTKITKKPINDTLNITITLIGIALLLWFSIAVLISNLVNK